MLRIQRFCVYWKNFIKNPQTKLAKKKRAVALIQKVLRGYQARRAHMYEILNAKADAMHEPFRIVDIISRGHFQRRVRRVWLDYKWRKAEKKRKKAERLAKSKGKKKKKKKKPAATLPPGTSIDMLDGMTNINLGQTGDGEIPEAGEDGEEGGDDLERGDGEEGEDGEKAEGEDAGPKVTLEQSEELKKAFDEKHADQEGLITKEEITALL